MGVESFRQQDKSAYILITPAKNEEGSLPGLIRSIVSQTLRPAAWFVVDDSSNDLSPQIIGQAASQNHWMHPVSLAADSGYDLGKHYASVCIAGVEHALAYCHENNVDFGYIALSDADMEYPDDYFARCIGFLRDNGQFGIVSGKILVKDAGGGVQDEGGIELGDGQPLGTGRVWSKQAFFDTGGYVLAKAPDTVSNVKALARGWRIKRLTDVVCYQTRYTAGKSGLWRGYLDRGERAYYMGMTPLSIFNALVDMILISRPKGCVTRSLALLFGYCRSAVRREEQIDDDEIRRYFGSHRRILRNYWLYLRSLKKRPKSHQP